MPEPERPEVFVHLLPGLIPPGARYDPLAQARRLNEVAQQAPKSIKWKLGATTGDRVRWYELPEEVAH